jgi:peroxiredoxin
MRAFQQTITELESRGARVAGISADTYASLGAFGEQNEITFPLLSDWPDLKTLETFGVRREGGRVAQRATFVFDEQGALRGVVDDQRDMAVHPAGALKLVKEIRGEAG